MSSLKPQKASEINIEESITTVLQHIRQGMYEKKGLTNKAIVDIQALSISEWDDGFEQLMRNRLIIGAIRYGPLNPNTIKGFDRVGYIKTKLNRYEATGNLEALVDIANLALVEFVEGKHEKRHFASLDCTEEHAKKI